MAQRRIRIGIDTGGTFTDVVAFDEDSGELITTKTPSTPANPADGFINGVHKVLGLLGADGGDVTAVCHGTTVATNQLLEGKVEELGFITTLSYRSRTSQFEIATPLFGFDQPGFALWDASLVWRSADDRWSIGLHGKNLTDQRYVTSGYNFLLVDPVTGVPIRDAQGNLRSALGPDGVFTAFYGNPRQIYVTVGLNFR